MDDDYEIIPKQEIEALKKEIEAIKKNPLKNTPTDLLSGIVQLDTSIHMLIDVFKEAEKHLKEEVPENNEVLKRIEKIEEQNKDIASALVTFAENMGHVQEEIKNLEKTIKTLKEQKQPKNDKDVIGSFWKQQKPHPVFEEAKQRENNTSSETQPSHLNAQQPSAEMPPPPSQIPSPSAVPPPPPFSPPPQGAVQNPPPSPFAPDQKPNPLPPPPPGFHVPQQPPQNIPPGFENSLGTIAKKRLFQQDEGSIKPQMPPGMPPPPPKK